MSTLFLLFVACGPPDKLLGDSNVFLEDTDVQPTEPSAEPPPITVNSVLAGDAAVGDLITLEGLIVTTPSNEDGFFAADSTGGENSGIWIQADLENKGIFDVEIGQTITVEGIYAEPVEDASYHEGEDDSLSTIVVSAQTDIVVDTSVPIQEPTSSDISTEDLTSASTAEDYEGVLLKISEPVLTMVDDKMVINGTIPISSRFFDVVTLDLDNNATLSMIYGVLGYEMGQYCFCPRHESDLIFDDNDADNDGFTSDNGDCDDADASINPSALEVCDGIDNDCDTLIDDDDDGVDPSTQSTWYQDADDDLHGDGSSTVQACVVPVGFVSNDLDCNDSDSSINPAATEICDAVDNDCDTFIDEQDPDLDLTTQSEWYPDVDFDGYGDPTNPTVSCTMPSGHVSNDLDCNDSDYSISPVAPEICDTVDNDCDSFIDDDDSDLDMSSTYTVYSDDDGDGYGDLNSARAACFAGYFEVYNGDDCDDGNAAINPVATEVCDTHDNDCNGLVDDDDPNVDQYTQSEWFIDVDGDGYGDLTSVTVACFAPLTHVSDHTDCDDGNAAINPSASEVCDGHDNDCNSLVDDDDPNVDQYTQSEWFFDFDGDGYGGNTSNALVSCDQPNGMVSNNSDCDDAVSSIKPGATEVCDTHDNDCNGLVDDDDPNLAPGSATSWYADADGDGFGSPSSPQVLSCEQPSGSTSDSTDCDDNDANVNPEQPEVCNDGLDSDCDTLDDRPQCAWSENDLLINLELDGGHTYEVSNTGGDYNHNGVAETYWLIKEFDPNDGLISTQFCGFDLVHFNGGGFDLSACTLSSFTTTDSDWTDMRFAESAYGTNQDFTGDGFDNLILGVEGHNGVGAVVVYPPPITQSFNASNPLQSRILIENPESDGGFGSRIAYAGDLDEDGLADVLTTSPHSDLNGTDSGLVYLFYGLSGNGSISQVTVSGNVGDHLGSAIASGKDVNGDGVDDLVISASRADYQNVYGGSETDTGAVYVFHGPINPNQQSLSSIDADQIIYGDESYRQLGLEAATVNDYDGDGLSDLLVASENQAGTTSNSGAAYVVTDSSSSEIFSYESHFQIFGDADLNGAGDRFGHSVLSLGDLDQDGLDEIAIGARSTDYHEADGGSIHVFYGGRSGSSYAENANVIIGGTSGSQFGTHMSLIPDLVQQDGLQDLLIGSLHDTANGSTISSGILSGAQLQ